MIANNAHIVAIRQNGVIAGHQLRINGGGAGMSKFFASIKYGGPEKAEREARRMAKEMGLPKPRPRGGSRVGRVPASSTSQAAGIRFGWTQTQAGEALLRVIATWTDKKGVSRHTSYSVHRHGLEDALSMAIKARTSCGAPAPDEAALLKRLKREYRTQASLHG
jgi:hypothetical protein